MKTKVNLNKMISTFILMSLILLSIMPNCFGVAKTVTPTTSRIFLDFNQVYFETYLIDGYNYFKLRNLAYVFNNTNKRFQVEWNENLNRIDISLGKEYTSIGTEMKNLNPSRLQKNAMSTTSEIYIDDVKKEFTTYNIDGYNYFKLRDILKIIDCGVDYDEKTKFIYIYTSKEYIPDEYVKIPILLYHHLEENYNGSNGMIITPKKFENDVITILSNGYTPISFKELADYTLFGKALPQKPIIITFDDGYLSNYQYAYPILKKYNIKASIFAIVKYFEENINGYPHFTYGQATEMINSGLVEVQAHTYDMHGGIIDFNDFYADTLKATQKLKDNLGIPIYAFAYPYGVYNNSIQSILDKTGISISLTTQEGINFVDKGDLQTLKLLKRYTVFPNTNIQSILNIADYTERVGVK